MAHLAHPRGDRLAHALLEGEAEGAVAAVATAAEQLLRGGIMVGCHLFLVETAEVVDAQLVDVGVVSGVQTGEVLAEVGAVGAQSLRQLVDGEITLQVELRVDAVLL